MYEVPVSQFLQCVKVEKQPPATSFEEQFSSISTTPSWFGIIHKFAETVLYSIIQVVIKDIKQYQPSIIASGIPEVTNNQLDFVLLGTSCETSDPVIFLTICHPCNLRFT